ncbi:MAG: hypothetical protein GDA46_03260 [Bdellovibrionales bacterium]|nr:hypothetical protein [Bdellovibrionales bacterium]
MFESSEKKIEIILSEKTPSLLQKPEFFWKQILKFCGAEIISLLKTPYIHSYLLSESSLLIWKNRLVLITCGKTVLYQSFIKLFKSFSKEFIETYFFQRKNEFFPYNQKNSFYKDLEKIKKTIPGQAYRFGNLHDHHLFLFYKEKTYKPREPDQTLEILFYDSKIIKNTSVKTISNLKKSLKKIFPKFKVQDHFFKPSGYSLNAIEKETYYTIHITPDKSFFYISFETNIASKKTSVLIKKILPIFSPLNFDLILFQSHHYPPLKLNLTNFSPHSFFYKKLLNSYNVYYKTFYSIQKKEQKPVLLTKRA